MVMRVVEGRAPIGGAGPTKLPTAAELAQLELLTLQLAATVERDRLIRGPAWPAPVKPAPAPVRPALVPKAPPPMVTPAWAQRVLNRVNQHRRLAGLQPLTMVPSLSQLADQRSADMAKRNYFSHFSPEGTTPWTRLKAAHIPHKDGNENLAKGPAGAFTPESVVDFWMGKPSVGHRENVLNPKWRHMGIGVSQDAAGQEVWTQLFTD